MIRQKPRLGFCAHLMFLCFVWASGKAAASKNNDNGATAEAAVYIVTMKSPSASHFKYDHNDANFLKRFASSSTAVRSHWGPFITFTRPRQASRDTNYSSHVIQLQDSLLRRVLKGENYLKLYSYHYLINGFALLATDQQAAKLADRHEVASVVLDYSVGTATTHTPAFLGLPEGAWIQDGGPDDAGEGIVIGFIDTGIDPKHPSFADDISSHTYPIPAHFSGICEVTHDFPSGSCNRKLVGARHFAASAVTRGIFNASRDFASPFDGDGHGTHTASIAAGNHGIPVIVSGHHFGNASGMAPHAHIAVYKALYKRFGGFAADVVAAIDQAAKDGVDIISLSITPNRRPSGIATFFNPIDMALLSAVKEGIFVVQAAGNTGPLPKSISSFSPWIFTVGAAVHDRKYSNCIVLGNNITIRGVGLASGTAGDSMHALVAASHALKNDTSDLTDINHGECQDPAILDKDVIKGNLLICSYSIKYVLGISSIKRALQTARNVSALGVIFYMDPFVSGFQINPTPMNMPGLIIQSPEDSKIFLRYYNDSLLQDGSSNSTAFTGTARILGGVEANYSNVAPKVVFYSARGPDPEDNSFHNADIMKPNLIAPGNLIWGAWSSSGSDSSEFEGENFAMISGTSMAAPHIAGLAALIKQKFPTFSPAAIASALSTTASLYDKQGGPILAQRARRHTTPEEKQLSATPFDMGSGFVNATAALDPGLIFDSKFDDYMSFLCGINGSAAVVKNYTGFNCGASTINSTDLNLPSITVSRLQKSKTLTRTVKNIANNETYHVTWSSPNGVSVSVTPTKFFIANGQTQQLSVVLNASMNSTIPSFGRIRLHGTLGHAVNIPVSVISKLSYDNTVN